MGAIGVPGVGWWLATTPSKVPFYIAAGLLVGWAVALAACGITSADFPGTRAQGRLVMLTSAALVAATIGLAVATASKPGATEQAPAAEGPLALAADPSGQPAFDHRQLSAAAGKIELRFTNRSPVPHNVTIARDGTTAAATRTITRGATVIRTSLPAGRYTFYCSVDAHRQAGMQGTLTVR